MRGREYRPLDPRCRRGVGLFLEYLTRTTRDPGWSQMRVIGTLSLIVWRSRCAVWKAPSVRMRPADFHVVGSGTISEDIPDVSESGSATGSMIGSGGFGGTFTAGGSFPPPMCPSTGTTVEGTLVLTAASGDSLLEQVSGSACVSAFEAATVPSTLRYVINGGTGRFHYATGHGSDKGLSVFSIGNFPVNASGSTTFTENGTIDLNFSARLAATPARCTQLLTARVMGNGIASVKWSLNRRPIRGRAVPRKSRYVASVKLSPGADRLTVRVTFVASSRVHARTFHRTVLGCSTSSPKFTG